MKQEKFKTIDFIRIFIKSISVNLDSFPKKEYEIKERIKKNSYDMLELAYEANSTEFIELKINLINKMLAKIKLIDFLLDLSVDMELLPNKKYIKLANRLADIEKFSCGWLVQAKRSFTTLKDNVNKGANDNTIIVESDKKGKLRSEKQPNTILLSKQAKNNLNQIL